MAKNQDKILIAKKVSEDDPLFKAVEQLPTITYKELRSFSEKLMILIPSILAVYLAGIRLSKIKINCGHFIPISSLIFSQVLVLVMLYPRKGKKLSLYAQLLRKDIYKGIKTSRRLVFFAFLFYILGIVSASIILVLT
jgi:hypothetical protein